MTRSFITVSSKQMNGRVPQGRWLLIIANIKLVSQCNTSAATNLLFEPIVDLQLHEKNTFAHVERFLQLVKRSVDVLLYRRLLVGQLLQDVWQNLQGRVDLWESADEKGKCTRRKREWVMGGQWKKWKSTVQPQYFRSLTDILWSHGILRDPWPDLLLTASSWSCSEAFCCSSTSLSGTVGCSACSPLVHSSHIAVSQGGQ